MPSVGREASKSAAFNLSNHFKDLPANLGDQAGFGPQMSKLLHLVFIAQKHGSLPLVACHPCLVLKNNGPIVGPRDSDMIRIAYAFDHLFRNE